MATITPPHALLPFRPQMLITSVAALRSSEMVRDAGEIRGCYSCPLTVACRRSCHLKRYSSLASLSSPLLLLLLFAPWLFLAHSFAPLLALHLALSPLLEFPF
eukprot:1445390-Pleurochrysis_carterae.AAC.1